MNDAHVYEMQVQMWKPNTWGVTVRVSPCFQNDGMEGEGEKGLSQELPAGGQRREDSASCRGGTVGVADRKERRRSVLEREARASASAEREGKSWVGDQRME